MPNKAALIKTQAITKVTTAIVILLVLLFAVQVFPPYSQLPVQTALAGFEGELGIPSNIVYAVAKDIDGNYWFGTSDGPAKKSGGHWNYYARKDNFPAKTVYDIAVIPDGQIWFATERGLIRLKNNEFTIFGRESGSSFQFVYRFYMIDNDLWFSTDNGFRAYTKDGGWDQFLASEKEPWLTQSLALAKGPNGAMWVGNFGLYSSIDKKSWQSYDPPQGFPVQITSVLPLSSGNVWIGTSKGMAQLKPNGRQWDFVFSHNAPKNVYIYDITADPSGGFWASTENGAYFYKPEEGWKRLTTADGLTSNNVFQIMIEDDGTKWFSTDNGAVRISGNIITAFQEKKFLSDIGDVSWAKPYIRQLYLRNITSGFSDGTFKPSNNITRSEALKMVLVGANKQKEVSSEALEIPEEIWDVDIGNWQAPYINYAIKNGIMEPRTAARFHPDLPASRFETLKAIIKAFNITTLDTTTSRFNDVTILQAAIVETGFSFGLVGGRTATTFAPDDKITRAEFAKILTSTIQLKE